MARKSHARKHNRRNTTAAKHYELRNGPAQTQALPGQYIRRTRNGTLYKPDLLLVVNTALNTVVPMSTQKPVDVFEGDRLYTGIRKQQQNAGFAKKCFFSRLVRDQNLASRLIFHLQQTLVEQSLEER